MRLKLNFALFLLALTGAWGTGFAAEVSATITTAPGLAISEPSQLVSTGEDPEWVSLAGIDTHADFASDTVLFDTQIKVDDQGYTLFRRHARRLGPGQMSPQGAPISFTIAPGKEHLILHNVVLWRSGVPHDAIDQVSLSIDRPGLEQSGTAPYVVTGHIIGAEPGDVLDWSASWHVDSPDWPGHFFHEFYTDWAVPSLHDRTRILIAQNRPLSIRLRGNAQAPAVRQFGGLTEYLWEAYEINPVAYVPEAPADAFVFSSVSVSTAMTWSQVVDWGTPRYRADTKFPQELRRQIKLQNQRPLNDRVTWAIRYAQDDIPYDHNRDGLSTHIARTPIQTLAEGRGDCKDKALLLVSLLHALGVKAAVALTDIDEGLALPHRAPSAFAFDHAVVRISTKNGVLYVDPTQTSQGGTFPNIAPAQFGYALPLAHGHSLEAMPTMAVTRPEIEIEEVFDATNDIHPGMSLTATTLRRGRSADAFRHTLAQQSQEALAVRYASWYDASYTGIRPTEDLVVIDDRERNEIRVVERYVIPEHTLTPSMRKRFPMSAEVIRWETMEMLEPDRQTSVTLEAMRHITHTIRLVGAQKEWPALNDMSVEGESLRFSRRIRHDGEALEIAHSIAPKSSSMTAAEWTRIERALRHFDDGLDIVLDISSEAQELASAAR